MSTKKQPKTRRPTRAVFTQGGKGGVGKTEVALALTSWYRARGIEPTLLDFDVENSNKGGFQSFYPKAQKLDLHQEGSLDAFFNAFDSDAPVVLADLAGGASNVAQTWFEDAAGYAMEMNVAFTAVGVTTNDAGSIQSVLKWAGHLQDTVDYLIVLNEMRSPRSKFNYWNDAPKVAEFVDAMNPSVMSMMARIEEFQAELRNHACTLEDIIEEKVDAEFFRYTRNIVRAKIYQRNLFEGFDAAANILLPGEALETAELPLS
jgi:MinD-like ATPase involved in chromosome partitioning or flagellar assembly